ncbi:SET domain-containing protein 9-like isoform X1 [Biomphalaria glabrata]|uniref:SET domain-containing protein 9-like isoform X1 n=1 Tax=Biomphalaria glabrata TaxID=6526 RepID=A0A9U8EFT6_BIOGL|nr:SET domain-containing protein 9-like isoform X1 [Biomphalaria glabrata]XP_013084946.2 SET domain-containing protein 9-like isoform X1 [Biomphalaria glabrata]XP_013084947.2 SET domain-containing protein 9-like isoform X1 [Biomphalaria glabrata]XP_013084950.2 SET domain-containing protein 9-like isoform X1 [Biomphalaria glabrata]XP_013084951.2 SET domain-containing protein 9-like isoform X1 [Biomphalaria glabrata]XP_013084952.2 SET domain-containing protein 9-like isoform X1 [Biomphalaria gla
MKELILKWKQYKYRFVPWLIVNFKNRSIQSNTELDSSFVATEKLQADLYTFLCGLHKHFEKLQPKTEEHKHIAGLDFMKEFSGFTVERSASIVPNCGQGVKVTSGTVQPGCITSLYPGLIYEPYEHIFFQSLGNQFILRCADGLLIDGNDKGLSKSLYKSCRGRDSFWPLPACDDSWLNLHNACPLNVGQYVNNHNKQYPANVAYQELDISTDFPAHLRQYLPNNYYSSVIHSPNGTNRSLRVVALVSLQTIHCNEEMFSSYFTVVR